MKVNVFTLLATVVVQFVVGYLWYSSYMFGGVVSVGDHTIDFLKLDVISVLLLILSSYGLTSILETVSVGKGIKDIGGAVKTGLTFGVFGIGLPITFLLSLLGITKVALLVIFTHLVITTILTSIVILKLKK
jgi:hypothetical protein